VRRHIAATSFVSLLDFRGQIFIDLIVCVTGALGHVTARRRRPRRLFAAIGRWSLASRSIAIAVAIPAAAAASPAASSSAALIASLARWPLATWRIATWLFHTIAPHAALRLVRRQVSFGPDFPLQFHRLVPIQIEISFFAGRLDIGFMLRRRATLAKLTTATATTAAPPAAASVTVSSFVTTQLLAASRAAQRQIRSCSFGNVVLQH
jgi:hypothetical protein